MQLQHRSHTMPRPARTAARPVAVTYTESPEHSYITDDGFEEKNNNRKQNRHSEEPTEATAKPRARGPRVRPRISDARSITSTNSAEPQTPRTSTPAARQHNARARISGIQSKTPAERLRETQRKRVSLGTRTPVQIPLRDEDVPSNLEIRNTAGAITPLKRVPVLANFEDWLKLATDNKINATNSWNFALIDYFHDMSLLKEGDGVNFQKASCTLDGCVKIYTGRVDSVAIETGRLLSGLADSNTDENGKKKRRNEVEDEDDDEEGDAGEGEDGEDGARQKKKQKKKARSHEATLAPSFASLQVRKLELEFAVDPLFKKATADFDEGGAKGLLLNHLCIDSTGRIVFDSSDDVVVDSTTDGSEDQVQDEEGGERPVQHLIDDDCPEIDIGSLATKFFPDLSLLDRLQICPSMSSFRLGDPYADLDLGAIKSQHEDYKRQSPQKSAEQVPPPPRIDLNLGIADETGIFLGGNNDFDDDDAEDFFGGLSLNDQAVGFGEGGEAWAKEAAAHPQPRPVYANDDDIDQDAVGHGYGESVQRRYQDSAEQEEMLAFFGKAMNSRAKVGSTAFKKLVQNSMAETNWKIARLQKQAAEEAAPATRTRKEKEPFQIDFLAGPSPALLKLLAQEPANNSAISLSKTQLKTKGANLMDADDEVVDVKKMMYLWTKPKCRVIRRRGPGPYIIDEGFGGRGREQARLDDGHDLNNEEEEVGGGGNYDADFFADHTPLGLPFDGPLPGIDDEDDDEDDANGGLMLADDERPFVDAREMLSPTQNPYAQTNNLAEALIDSDQQTAAAEQISPATNDDEGQLPTTSQSEPLPGSFGSQLVTQTNARRLRPEYVNYAKTAKKVDVRVLKENMWKGMKGRLDVFGEDEAEDRTREEDVPPLDHDGDSSMSEPSQDEPDQNQENLANDDNGKNETAEKSGKEGEILKFTSILSDLTHLYPPHQMRDISTSYGFICLLHLANEKGLVLEGGREDGRMEEILVWRDRGVEGEV